MMRRALVVLALAASAAPAGAQSLFGMRGLGVPVDPIDPRARALGSVGTGLIDLNTSLVNPADLAGIRRRGVVATVQPFFGSDEIDGRIDDVESTRFPLIQIIYPIRTRLVVGLGYGGFLDQSWGVVREGEATIGDETVRTREIIAATGAISQARLSAAYDVTPSFAVGAALGLYTGNLQRDLERTFPDSAGSDFARFVQFQEWEYRAFQATVGVRVDPSNTTRFGVAVTASTNLDADPDTGLAISRSRSYSMPLRLVAGASMLVAPRLLATVGGQFTGWSESTNFATPDVADSVHISGRPVFEVGGGLEWEQLRSGTRIFPLRVGYRYAQLPFALATDDAANEWAASLGLGLRLRADNFGPLAVADISVERGRRTGWESTVVGGLSETFWRFSASIALFGR
jgi:hypothetical protein